MIGKFTVHESLAKLQLVKDFSAKMVRLSMAYYTRRKLNSYVLLVSVLKDVFLLGAVGVYILLAELFAVGIKAVIHCTDECGSRYRISCRIYTCYVVFLDRRYVLADSVNIIHLFAQNVKRFYKLVGGVVEIAVMSFGCISIRPLFNDHVSIAVIGQILYRAIFICHALESVASGFVIIGYKILCAYIYACQISICVVAHGIRLTVTAYNGGQVIIAVIAVAYRAAVGSYNCGSSARGIVGVACCIAATVDYLGRLRRYRVILILGFISARVNFGGLVVTDIGIGITCAGFCKLLFGVDRSKLAVFEVGSRQCVAEKTPHPT